ncbi:hypothetical protein OHB12_12045 [Nocardia sp. NBC_01730]|uniref:DUF6875 domain-containing protein n=1 Tax=Nocardia sp. NBC_01730 TaxID=2975998 RepID=UPI002E1038DA|nr:hypothetical protein OHB12_12045 [Nocardia sp. NBC_01730]
MSLTDNFPFLPGSLTDIANAYKLFERFPQYQSVLGWVGDFVLTPDSRLRRPGAVCPRLAVAIDQNLVRLVAVRTTRPTVDEALDTVPALADLYVELFDEAESFRRGALLAVYTDIDPDGAAEFIDGGHARLRPDFVRRGLMLGEFHQSSSVGSVHNPAFPVMQSPVPMFAVRALSAHDILFLDRPGEQREELLGYYLEHVGDRAPAPVIGRVQRTLAAMGR